MAQRADVVWANLNPTRGHEQNGIRPCVVISNDRFNTSRAGKLVILPITSTRYPHPLRVPVELPEGGLSVPSDILVDQIRTISTARLVPNRNSGRLQATTMDQIDAAIKLLLALP